MAMMKVEGCWALFGDADADHVLVCFSPAGSNPTASFRSWKAALPDSVCILGYCRPGRSFRDGVKLTSDFDGIVDEVVNGLLEFFSAHPAKPAGRLVFFGHSMGSLEAFAVAAALDAQPCYQEIVPLPARLVVVGHSAPDFESAGVPPADASDEEMCERLAALGGFNESAWTPDLVKMFVPVFRADLAIHEAYYRKPREERSAVLARIPIAYLGGSHDVVASRHAQEAWSNRSAHNVSISWYPGGHFFFNDTPNLQSFFDFLQSSFQ